MASPHASVLDEVRSGRAASRADVARVLAVSASTASARVDALVRRGLLVEHSESGARVGRRPRRLSLRPGLGTVAAVELGPVRARTVLADLTGEVLCVGDVPVPLTRGPEEVLGAVAEALRAQAPDDRPPLHAVCVGVPGPVGPALDHVVAPARMPGWNGVDVAALGQRLFGVPTMVENDANLIAVGQHQHRPGGGQRVVVTVDAGIGCGVLVDGRLFRGASGMAGDISHTTVADAPEIPCSCGRTACLDVVASGSALLDSLTAAGVAAEGMDDLIRMVHDGQPLATGLVREAGERIGAVLSTVISFFNPDELVLAGPVSSLPTFMAALRSTVYASCLPATTASLTITRADDEGEATLAGAVRVAADKAFAEGPLAARIG
ncbi:ROK family transcriptional regulator [Nocardioides campestrisoli]|uniref:ROK family transcriptional regulator n=1 Tax=Nocardioides campestrisoli TaxID=2736757 RepID=UPI00163D3F59|nr:ROK family protein [Nocardioides campestrisoli]